MTAASPKACSQQLVLLSCSMAWLLAPRMPRAQPQRRSGSPSSQHSKAALRMQAARRFR